MRRSAGLGISIAVAALMTPTSRCAAQGVPHDVTLAMQIRTDSGSKSQTVTERIMVSGSKVRMEIGSDALSATGGVSMIIDRSDSTMTTIMPTAKMAMLIRMPTLGGMIELPKVSVDSTDGVKTEDLGVGEPILGYATNHTRMATSSATRMTFADRVCTKRMD